MPFDYSAANVTPGRTIRVVMNNLPPMPRREGEEASPGFPVAHVELLNDDNRSYQGYLIQRADASKKKGKLIDEKPKTLEARVERAMEQTAEKRAERRREIHHAVRKIEARHSDGADATEADIPAWIAALPQDAVDRIWIIAHDEDMFRDGLWTPTNTEVEIAEK